MKISGFTFVRNATKLFYPVKAAIESVLPIVDEFVVALGDNDTDDHTREEILAIQSDKIRIIDTVWDQKKYPRGMEYAHQTDIAREACQGDWLFYIQSDEAIHEKYLSVVAAACEKYKNDAEVEGFLFDYKHFWGDFEHHLVTHVLYPLEIRVIRNRKDIHSWKDAQSFRVIPDFDGKDYFQKEGTRKLKVVKIDACIHHYGFVRPPELMQKKTINHRNNLKGNSSGIDASQLFDYGDLSKLDQFKDSHPAVMKDWIEKFDWQDKLYPNRPALRNHKHDKLRYRMLTFIEQKLRGGRSLWGFQNYILLKRN